MFPREIIISLYSTMFAQNHSYIYKSFWNIFDVDAYSTLLSIFMLFITYRSQFKHLMHSIPRSNTVHIRELNFNLNAAIGSYISTALHLDAKSSRTNIHIRAKVDWNSSRRLLHAKTIFFCNKYQVCLDMILFIKLI